MGKSDLETVHARRRALSRKLADLDSARAALETEQSELEATERVLHRLADYFVAQPGASAAAASPPRAEQPAHAAQPNILMSQAAGRIRGLIDAVSRRTMQAGR